MVRASPVGSSRGGACDVHRCRGRRRRTAPAAAPRRSPAPPAAARRVRPPGPAAPLPVGEYQFQRAVRGHRDGARAVQVRQRLRGRQGGRHGGEHGVAGLRPGPGEGGLGQDLRPQRVGLGLTQVHAVQAGRTPRQDQRPHHADRLPGAQRQVRHPVAHQLPGQVGQRRPGEDHQVRDAAVVARPDLGRGALDGPGGPLLPRRPQVGKHQPGGREVGGLGGLRVGAADVPDAGGGQEAGHAGAGPARAVHPHVTGPPPGQGARPAVPVRVGQRRGGQFGGQPGAQLLGERGVHPGREVVEHARRGQHREHPVGRRGRHAVACAAAITLSRSRLPSSRLSTAAVWPSPATATARRGSTPNCSVSRSRHTGSSPAFNAGLMPACCHRPVTFRPRRARSRSYRPFRSGTEASTRVVISAASGSAGTRSAAVATSSPHSPAPAASPISTPNLRSPCGVS